MQNVRFSLAITLAVGLAASGNSIASPISDG